MDEARTPETGTRSLTPEEAAARLTQPAPTPEDTVEEADAPEGTHEEGREEGDEAEETTGADTPEEPEAVEDDDTADGDTDDEQEDDAEGPEEDTQSVTIDGQRYTLEELKRGFMRESDYTRKTKELAEGRRKAEEAAAEAARVRDTFAQKLQETLQALGEPKEPDWDELYRQDPVEFAVQRERWAVRREKREKLQKEMQQIHQQQAQAIQAQVQEQLKGEVEKLVEAVPEWRNPSEGAKGIKDLKAFATETYGFSEQDLAGIVNHKAVLLLRDAKRYQDMRSKREAAKGKVKDKPPVLRPGTAKSKGSDQQRAQKSLRAKLKRTGDPNDAVALLLSRT